MDTFDDKGTKFVDAKDYRKLERKLATANAEIERLKEEYTTKQTLLMINKGLNEITCTIGLLVEAVKEQTEVIRPVTADIYYAHTPLDIDYHPEVLGGGSEPVEPSKEEP